MNASGKKSWELLCSVASTISNDKYFVQITRLNPTKMISYSTVIAFDSIV